MAWKDNLQTASFRGKTFDVEKTQDSTSRDHAIHEYPFRDGADVHDLGRKARNFRLTALLWGEDYDDRLKALIAEMDKPGAGELVHPIYGSLTAQLIEYQIQHDAEHPDFCRVEMVYLESVTGTAVSGAGDDKAPPGGIDGMLNRLDGLKDKAQTLFDQAIAPLNKVRATLKKARIVATGMINTLATIRGEVSGFMDDAISLVQAPGQYAGQLLDILNPASTPLGRLLNRPQPGVIFTPPGQYHSADEGWHMPRQASGRAAASLPLAPAPVLSAWRDSVAQMIRLTQLPDEMCCGAMALPAPLPDDVRPADMCELTAIHKIVAALQLARLAVDLLTSDEVVAVLPVQDLEAVAHDVRQVIADAVMDIRAIWQPPGYDDNGGLAQVPLPPAGGEASPVPLLWRPVTESLKSAALDIQWLALAQMATRPPLTVRPSPVTGNLHRIAFIWYGDYHRADELRLLNPQIRDPNSVERGDPINGYAG